MALAKAVIGAGAYAVLVLGARAARAQPEAPPPGDQAFHARDATAHTHHGFYARALVGPAGLATHATISGYHETLLAAGGGLNLAVGWSVSPSLVIYGEAFDHRSKGLYHSLTGEGGESAAAFSADLIGIGPGVAHYVPSNLYLSATLAFSKLRIDDNEPDVASIHRADTDIGVGVSGAVGKEWWVSNGWGLGLAGQVFLGSIPEGGGSDALWNTATLTMAFSATYN